MHIGFDLTHDSSNGRGIRETNLKKLCLLYIHVIFLAIKSTLFCKKIKVYTHAWMNRWCLFSIIHLYSRLFLPYTSLFCCINLSFHGFCAQYQHFPLSPIYFLVQFSFWILNDIESWFFCAETMSLNINIKLLHGCNKIIHTSLSRTLF